MYFYLVQREVAPLEQIGKSINASVVQWLEEQVQVCVGVVCFCIHVTYVYSTYVRINASVIQGLEEQVQVCVSVLCCCIYVTYVYKHIYIHTLCTRTYSSMYVRTHPSICDTGARRTSPGMCECFMLLYLCNICV